MELIAAVKGLKMEWFGLLLLWLVLGRGETSEGTTQARRKGPEKDETDRLAI